MGVVLNSSPELAEHLRQLEELLLDPAVRRDRAQLTRVLAPAFREFGSSGRVFDRETIIADLALEHPSSSSKLSLADFLLVAHTETWALVTYRSLRHDSGGALQSTALRSSTWVRAGDRWQMLFHQGTSQPLAPQAAHSPEID